MKNKFKYKNKKVENFIWWTSKQFISKKRVLDWNHNFQLIEGNIAWENVDSIEN